MTDHPAAGRARIGTGQSLAKSASAAKNETAADDLQRFLTETIRDNIQIVTIDQAGHVDARYFGADATAAAAWARHRNGEHSRQNIYYSTNSVRPGLNTKAKKSDIERVRFAHVDIDPPKDGSPWDSDEAVEQLEMASVPPSIIISSGNGIQALWRLEEGVTHADAENVNTTLIDVFNGDAGTWDVSRVLRLPGTINWPTPKKQALGRTPVWASIVRADDGTVHTVAELGRAYRTTAKSQSPAARKAAPVPTIAEIELLSADDLDPLPTDYVRNLIERPEKLDRSADTLALAGAMVRDGYSDAAIFGILLNHANAISDHCLEQGDGAKHATRAARRAIEKARGDEAERSAVSPGPLPVASEVGRPVRLPAPFRGFMADAYEAILASAHMRQPEITLMAVVVAMAAACPGTIHLPDGLRLNLFGLGVAPTASGKDHPFNVAREIAFEAGAKLLGDIATAAGAEDALTGDQAMLAVIDEIAHTLASRQDRGNSYLKGVEQMLLRLFSSSKSFYSIRALKGGKTNTIKNPCLSLLGFAVPSKLGEALGEGDVASGLLNRMLIAVGDGDAVPQSGIRTSFRLSETMKTKLEAVRKAGRLGVEITIPDAVQERIDQFTSELHAEKLKYPQDGPEWGLLGRTMEKAKRIAGNIAVFDDPENPVMTIEHLEWAVAFARASDAMLLDFLRRHMHGGKVQAHAARVVSIAASVLRGEVKAQRASEIAAVAAGFAPISVVLRSLGINSKELYEAIAHLEARGDIVRIEFEHAPRAGAASKIGALCFPAE